MGYKTDWFKGILPALVTPFTKDDRLDGSAYREVIRFVMPHVNGMVPSGTTGEFSYMTMEEKKQVEPQTTSVLLDIESRPQNGFFEWRRFDKDLGGTNVPNGQRQLSYLQ